MSEADERLPAGPRGAQGERGERGLSRVQGRAVVFLFALAVVLAGSSLFWNSYEVNANAAAQRQQQASQRAQGELLEQKLCTTLKPLAGLADLKPPAGNPADNPARAFEQALVLKLAPLAQLGPDLGCNATKGTP